MKWQDGPGQSSHDSFEPRGHDVEAGEDGGLRLTASALNPLGNEAPEIGARNPSLLAANIAKQFAPDLKLLSIFVIVPEISVRWNVPFGKQHRGTAGQTRGAVRIEQPGMLPFNDVLPKGPLLRRGKQSGNGASVARLLPTCREPCVDAIDGSGEPARAVLRELMSDCLVRCDGRKQRGWSNDGGVLLKQGEEAGTCEMHLRYVLLSRGAAKQTMIYMLAFLIGVVAGLRSMTPLAAVSWAARLGKLQLGGTWLAFLGMTATPYIFTVLAIGELIADKLPKTPSRKSPMGFGARIVSGALCGAAVSTPIVGWMGGLVAGVIGAIVGTLGGYEFRARLVRATGGRDLPIALLEDVIAIGLAILVVSRV